MFSFKCKFILHTAGPVVFFVFSFISFVYLENVTTMKPQALSPGISRWSPSRLDLLYLIQRVVWAAGVVRGQAVWGVVRRANPPGTVSAPSFSKCLSLGKLWDLLGLQFSSL